MARRADASVFWPQPARVETRPVSIDFFVLFTSHVLPAALFLMIAVSRAQDLARFVVQPRVGGDWLATAGFYASCVHKATAILFSLLIVLCFVIRQKPRRAARNLVQIVVALAGTFLMTAVAMSPHKATSSVVTIVAAVVMTAGTMLTAIAITYLGRSFSITPEARQLVTGGMYSVVRHPMYLGEMVGSFGLMLQAMSPFTVVVFAAFCFLQIKRMDYEERVLQQTFPEYVLYKARTARLIPGVY